MTRKIQSLCQRTWVTVISKEHSRQILMWVKALDWDMVLHKDNKHLK